MRIPTSLLILLFSLTLYASDFSVFEKDGFYGIRNTEGEVTVPAVYERLGWSDGSSEIRNGVIGYREGKLWGLITVKNKALTEQKFYTIAPLKGGYFKASVKGKFSNKLFHGILDEQGKTVVSFHYFTLEMLNDRLLVSEYDPKGLRYGIVTLDNRKLVPVKYSSISLVKSLYHARMKDKTIDLYKKSGQLIQSDIDSVFFQDGWKCFQDGRAGFIKADGEIRYSFEYKDFHLEEGILYPIRFPEWGVYENDQRSFSVEADSLAKTDRGFWITYLNGSHHFAVDSITRKSDFLVKEMNEDLMVLKNAKTRKWSVQKMSGDVVIKEMDSLVMYESGLWAKKGQNWKLFSMEGKKKNEYLYRRFLYGNEGQFIVRSNKHWGVIGYEGEEVAIAKYDSIIPDQGSYRIRYLNRWGVMDRTGKWTIRPEYDEIFLFDHLTVARRGLGYTVYSEESQGLKTTWVPIKQSGSMLMVQDSGGLFGLLDRNGSIFSYPQYTKIALLEGDHIVLQKGDSSRLISSSGKTIIDFEDEVQEVAGFGDDYFLIRKKDRWGYMDNQGRLRISNRYQAAKAFSQGMAAVKLRGKWGFINKSEELVVQPYYDEVQYFHDGLCIVASKGKYGLINSEGDEVLETEWTEIKRLPTGNYLVKNDLWKAGILNASGEFLLRPAFDSLEDFGNQVIISQNGKYGLLDYDGNQLFKVGYKEIKISGKYTLVKY